jgi:hypothetical protein
VFLEVKAMNRQVLGLVRDMSTVSSAEVEMGFDLRGASLAWVIRPATD